MTPQERIAELAAALKDARDYVEALAVSGYAADQVDIDAVCRRIDKALSTAPVAEGRDAGLEEAAKWHDDQAAYYEKENNQHGASGYRNVAWGTHEKSAKEIRSLKSNGGVG